MLRIPSRSATLHALHHIDMTIFSKQQSTIRAIPPCIETPLTLLLADTDSSSSSASSLGVLTTNSETPEVTETTVGSDLLETFQILTELAFHLIGQNLGVLAVGEITLSVEEPGWNLVLCWVLDDGDNSLELFGGNLTGTGYSHQLLALAKLCALKPTACSGQHRPSCRPSWSNGDRHP